MLFSPKGGRRPGPKGPSQDLLDAIVAMKQRNRTWGCPHIAPHIGLAFGVEIDQDVVRRIWSIPYRPKPNSEGPSWLTFLGHAKDRLGSCDSMRIRTLENLLGSGSDGPVYTSRDRIWRPPGYG